MSCFCGSDGEAGWWESVRPIVGPLLTSTMSTPTLAPTLVSPEASADVICTGVLRPDELCGEGPADVVEVSECITSPAAVTAMSSISRQVTVLNKLGLHARPAMQFVDVANQFSSDIMVRKGGDDPVDADGKSVMQMIILAATEGTPLQIEASGEDAEKAVAALVELFEKKFGEE